MSFNWRTWCGYAAFALAGSSSLLGACSDNPSSSGSPSTGGQGSGGEGDGEPQPGQAGKTNEAPKDREPPAFDGLREATETGETRVKLTWDPATDDSSPQESIAYAVYASTREGEQDFGEPLTVTPAGAAGALLSGLTPSTEYFFVVRAIDQAGNEDDNAAELSAQTEDENPPSFAGITKLTAATSRTLLLEWKPARDKGADPSEISYNAYVSGESGKQNFKKPTVTSKPGELQLLLPKQQPLTDYFVVVRAVDADGNEDDNDNELTVHTPEGVSPIFAGLKRAEAEPGGVRLYWPTGNDGPDGTEPANLVYDIFITTTPGQFDYSKPSFTSPPAAVTYFVEGLTPGTKYYFVVRARDAAGNTDSNTIDSTATAQAAADRAAPTFEGVKGVVGTSPSTLVASWSPAKDDTTDPEDLVYEVYVSDTSGTQDFNSPRLITPPGVTSATISGLPAGASRFFVVRARDQAGNSAPTKTEKKGSTLASPDADTTPPVLVGVPTLETIEGSPFELDVSWTEATDDHVADDIRYHVCAETVESDCVGLAFNSHIRATSDWGETSLTLTTVRSRTIYYVYVRAEDRSGNVEVENHGTSLRTLTSWAKDVSPILREKCQSCHTFSVALLKDVKGSFPDAEAAKVDPAAYGEGLPLIDGKNRRPEYSLIYRRINPLGLKAKPFSPSVPNDYVGSQEPRDGSSQYVFPLSGAEDGAIRDWITQGAYSE